VEATATSQFKSSVTEETVEASGIVLVLNFPQARCIAGPPL